MTMSADAKVKVKRIKEVKNDNKSSSSKLVKKTKKKPPKSNSRKNQKSNSAPCEDIISKDEHEKAEKLEAEVEEVSHSRLIRAIQTLDGKKAPIYQRSESSAKISEFHNAASKKIEVGHLLKPLQKSEMAQLKKALRRKQSQPSQTLDKPQAKLVVDKAERMVIYDQAKQEVDKWENVVEENRTTPHMEFPLDKPKISIEPIQREAASYKPRSALELEIQAVLKGPDYVARLKQEAAKPVLTKAEQRAQKAMDLEMAKEELALRRKHRLMVADMASKNKRQKKIKSRNYRRHLKASRRKEAFKALEKLKQENPELWQEKAEELERARIEERATLRHKGKGKFAKLARRYGKFNDKIKDSLDEMRAKGTELLQKQRVETDSESEEEDDEEDGASDFDINSDDAEEEREVSASSKSNPWMSSKLSKEKPATTAPVTRLFVPDSPLPVNHDPTDSAEESAADSDAFVESDDEISVNSRDKKRVESLLDDIQQQEMDADEMLEGQTTERIQTLSQVESFDDKFLENADENDAKAVTNPDGAETAPSTTRKKKSRKKRKDIDPDQVIVVPSTDLTTITNAAAAAEEASSEDDDTDQTRRINIAEAFADDDVVAEFKANKKRVYAEQDEKDNSASAFNVMPGWGFWSGAGLATIPKRKNLPKHVRVRLAAAEEAKAKLKEEKEKQRRKYPSGVIINEEAIRRQPIANYQVAKPSLPAATFKSMMSYPVGRDFVPTIAHNEMVKPKVKTALGKIIAPIDKDAVIEQTNRKRKKGEAFDSDSKSQKPVPIKQYEIGAEASAYLKRKKLAKDYAKAGS